LSNFGRGHGLSVKVLEHCECSKWNIRPFASSSRSPPEPIESSLSLWQIGPYPQIGAKWAF
jgi:hypothetical protein